MCSDLDTRVRNVASLGSYPCRVTESAIGAFVCLADKDLMLDRFN